MSAPSFALTAPSPARVYYEDEFATLHLGDCRDVLPTIERGSVVLLGVHRFLADT